MRARPDIWLVGVPIVAALSALGVWLETSRIEGGLRRSLQASIAAREASQLEHSGARVEVEGRDLTIETDAPAPDGARAEANGLVRRLGGLRQVIYRVAPPASVDPFTFSATRRGEDLVLGGHVPPGGVRPALLEAAQAGRGTVRDDLRSALGAPAGFAEAARIAIHVAQRLEGGVVAIHDRAITVSGDAPDIASYREATAALRSLPPGFALGAVAIRPPLVRPYTWSAFRERDGFVLDGHVPSEEERAILLAAIREAVGDVKVEDRMNVARGLDSGVGYDTVAKRVVATLAKLESGRASLEGRALVIDGKIAARDLLADLQAELKGVRLPGVELERLDLTPVIPRPYRLLAQRRTGRLRLAGFLPSDGDRVALREIVQRRFPFDAIVDDLHLADGAPDGMLPVARVGLERLATLADGEVAIEDRTIRLSGRSLYAELAARTRRSFPGEVPAGWAASADVSIAPDKPLDPAFCADLVEDVARREPVRFEAGKADLSPAIRTGIGAVADVMRRCGSARIVVTGGVPEVAPVESARAIAERRVAAVASAFAELGIRAEPRVAASPSADPGKPADRIEFEVQP